MVPVEHAHQHTKTRSEEEWRNRVAAGTNVSQNLSVVQALNAPWHCARGVSQRVLHCISSNIRRPRYAVGHKKMSFPKGCPAFTLPLADRGMPQGPILANGQPALCATMLQ